jgi:hypothetical protein
VEGSGHVLILRYNSGLRVEELTKNTKTSVKIAGLRAETLTRDFPKTNQDLIGLLLIPQMIYEH